VAARGARWVWGWCASAVLAWWLGAVDHRSATTPVKVLLLALLVTLDVGAAGAFAGAVGDFFGAGPAVGEGIVWVKVQGLLLAPLAGGVPVFIA